jgi:predicted AAA+ superfamily ATPase
MALSNRDRVGRGLELLAEGLKPFVDRHMASAAPDSRDWVEWLANRSGRDGRPITMSRSDPRFLVKVITEERRFFKDSLSHVEIAFASEIRDHGNKWAHNEPFSDSDALRALDTIARMLQAAGAVPEAEQVEKLWFDHQRTTFEKLTKKAIKESAALPGVEGMGLKPWRDVIAPHHDVATGNFTGSQFAANLHAVYREEATNEYGDAIEFFRRTYLTEGLSDLLKRAVRRISGDTNASPVINLQTNFGGGKTHSMLALYHIFSGRSLTAFPQEVQELLEGFALPKDGAVQRATLVGNHLSPSLGMPKPDGTHVNTLWGELAFQLGGRDGYDSIAESDRTGTNPGEALTDLITASSPCVILIDEWVAYARELYGTDLPAGTFDTQFTFAQTLTESVASVPGALLVVSIPASETGDVDASALEVGGPHGQEALRKLQNVVRRVADQWRPASAQESFEIVRRRLFEEPSGQARTDIAAVARRFTQFYAEHRGDFPSHCPEPAYEKRIRDAYPIHPELFDRLYEDWSTLERFQRTRGVLRLMSTVIHALWHAGDPYPLILPATIPLSDDRVFTDLTQYLEDSWKSIVDTDVDGRDSTPFKVDQQRPTFGQKALTRRLARTIFFGSAATLKSAHKGIDQQKIWTGTAVPGDTIPHFASALHVLADQGTYLYSDAARYWYDTQASVARTAKDHAERLRDRPEEIWAEIVRRLQPYARRNRGDFSGVHIAPEGTGDILDIDEARLVLLHPQYVHKRNGGDSPAMTFSRDALTTRGSSQRKHRNALVFLAPDERRMEELAEAAREFLAWDYIHSHAKPLDLTHTQIEQAANRRDKANSVVDQRIATTYIWVITPEQPNPTRPFELATVKAESQSTELVQRVSDKLRREGAIAAVHASRNIHHYLTGPLKSIWDRGHISVGELWAYYTEHPYLPRLRDRSVLEEGIREVLNSITWEQDGFALATGINETNGKFEGLALPHSDTFGLITDQVLLVRPDLANRQREEETQASPGTEPTDQDNVTPKPEDKIPVPPPPKPTPPEPKSKTRFFGVFSVNSEKYARDLTRLQQEILPHLVNEDGTLQITVEIEATKSEGFSQDKIRTVTENARVLKFEQSEFTEDQ